MSPLMIVGLLALAPLAALIWLVAFLRKINRDDARRRNLS